MQLRREWIRYPAAGQPVPAYLVRPARAASPLPAVLVIQEIWGVDRHIQDVAERFATAGYVALAPDLYGRGGERPAELAPERMDAVKVFLDGLPPAAWGDEQARQAALDALPAGRRQEVSATLATLFRPDRDLAQYTADLRAAAAFVRSLPASAERRLGSCGFCLGGALSWRLANSEPHMAAAVVYYGAGPEPDDVGVSHCPVLGLYGGEDHHVTDRVPALQAALQAAGRSFEPRVYARAPHAFFNDTRSSYQPEAARDAWARTLAFLNAALTPQG